MDIVDHFLIFTVEKQRYALPLANVERIIRAVEVTPLPEVPASVLGVINVQGKVVSVLSLRRRFRLLDREIDLDDRLVIAHNSNRTIALLVDAVIGVVESKRHDMILADDVVPGMEYGNAMIKLDNEMVLIPNIERLMTLKKVETHGQQ